MNQLIANPTQMIAGNPILSNALSVNANQRITVIDRNSAMRALFQLDANSVEYRIVQAAMLITDAQALADLQIVNRNISKQCSSQKKKINQLKSQLNDFGTENKIKADANSVKTKINAITATGLVLGTLTAFTPAAPFMGIFCLPAAFGAKELLERAVYGTKEERSIKTFQSIHKNASVTTAYKYVQAHGILRFSADRYDDFAKEYKKTHPRATFIAISEALNNEIKEEESREEIDCYYDDSDNV